MDDRPLAVFPSRSGYSRDYTFSFAIPVAGPASLDVYNVAGRKVATVASGEMPAGQRQITWQARDSDGRRISRGLYFARLTTPQGTKTTKFVHLR